jgi:hypothetical protein
MIGGMVVVRGDNTDDTVAPHKASKAFFVPHPDQRTIDALVRRSSCSWLDLSNAVKASIDVAPKLSTASARFRHALDNLETLQG